MHSKNSVSTRRKKVQLNHMQPKNKKANLQQHTQKIEQKLAKLKLQVNEKKNTTQKNRFTPQIQQKTLKQLSQKRTATGSRPSLNLKQKETPKVENIIPIENQLRNFLVEIAFSNYLPIFAENGIDSMDILEQIKQKQLEEIGIPKGHALKIIIQLRKRQSKVQKVEPNIINNQKQIIAKNDNHANQQKKAIETKPLQIIIQTQQNPDQIPIKKHRYFCLYCYKVNDGNDGQFCNQECSYFYNKMFEKYQKNLIKAQQNFGGSHNAKEQEEYDENVDENQATIQGINIVDFLNQQIQSIEDLGEDFDTQLYQEALNAISQAKIHKKQQKQQQQQEQNLYEN